MLTVKIAKLCIERVVYNVLRDTNPYIIARGLQVVIGMVDPDPRVSGGGLWTCKDAGMEVCLIGGDLEQECKDLNKVFIERVLAEKAAEEASS